MAQAETQQAAKTSFSETDKIIKCVNALGNQLTLVHSIGAQRTKSQFDGLSADQFLKWLAEVDNIYLEVDRDDKQTIWAASQLLRGSALEYYHDIATSLGSWEHLKTLMHAHYHHLHDADMAKQKLRTITQRQKETIPQYTDRLKLLAKQAYGTTIDESSVKEIITKAFINGIIHRKLQERVASKRPKTLKEAYDIAMDKTKLMTELALYTDHSKSETEPMDCSAVSDQKSELSEVKDLLKILVEREDRPVQSQPPQRYQVQSLTQPQTSHQNRFSDARGDRYPPQRQPQRPSPAPARYPPQGRPPRNVYQWTPDNRPICFYCGIPGHVHRVCRKKQHASRPPYRPKEQTQTGKLRTANQEN